MSARLGLVIHPCGHQTPIAQRGTFHSEQPCSDICRRKPRVCDYWHDHVWGDPSFDDCQAAAQRERRRLGRA